MADPTAGEFDYSPLDEDLPDLSMYHSQHSAPGDASGYHLTTVSSDYHDPISFASQYPLPNDLQPADEAGPSQPAAAYHDNNNNSNKKGKGKAKASQAGASTTPFRCDECDNTYTRQCDLK